VLDSVMVEGGGRARSRQLCTPEDQKRKGRPGYKKAGTGVAVAGQAYCLPWCMRGGVERGVF